MNVAGYELDDTAIALIRSLPRDAETVRFIRRETGGCGLVAALAIYDTLSESPAQPAEHKPPAPAYAPGEREAAIAVGTRPVRRERKERSE